MKKPVTLGWVLIWIASGVLGLFIGMVINPIDKPIDDPPQHYAWTVGVTYTDGTSDTVILHKDNDTDADLSIMLNVNGCIQTFVEDEKPEICGEMALLCGVRSFQLIGINKTQTSDYE